jgi:hypothetical protein
MTVSKVKLKVPDAESLKRFDQEWDKSVQPAISGEYNVPFGRDPISSISVDRRMVSHAIRDIDMSTYDPNTQTVVADVVFTGPYGRQAQDDYIRGEIRFCPRVLNKETKDGPAPTVITWDLIHKPGSSSAFDAAIAAAKEQLRQEENAKDRANEIKKKMRKR